MGDVAWLRGCLSGFFTFIPSITFKRSVKTWRCGMIARMSERFLDLFTWECLCYIWATPGPTRGSLSCLLFPFTLITYPLIYKGACWLTSLLVFFSPFPFSSSSFGTPDFRAWDISFSSSKDLIWACGNSFLHLEDPNFQGMDYFFLIGRPNIRHAFIFMIWKTRIFRAWCNSFSQTTYPPWAWALFLPVERHYSRHGIFPL